MFSYSSYLLYYLINSSSQHILTEIYYSNGTINAKLNLPYTSDVKIIIFSKISIYYFNFFFFFFKDNSNLIVGYLMLSFIHYQSQA